jgi:hypothetical protein
MAIKRQQIIDYIQNRAATITVANGYYTNLGNYVYVFKPGNTRKDDDEVYSLNITHNSQIPLDTEVEGMYNRQKYWLNVDFEITYRGASAVEYVLKALTDVKKMCSLNVTWNSLAIHTIIKPGTENEIMELEQGEYLVAGAQLFIQILYSTTEWLET